MSRSMLLRLFWQPKQWARLLRGLTVASISPQRGQRKQKWLSRFLAGGPSGPRAAIVTGIVSGRAKPATNGRAKTSHFEERVRRWVISRATFMPLETAHV